MIQYSKIAKVIEERIKNHIYPPFMKIPTQQQLADEFGTSRMTVKKAIDSLIYLGLLVSIRGSGTYVMSNPIANELDFSGKSYLGLSATMQGKGRNLSSKVIAFEHVFPDNLQQKRLLLNETDPVYRIIRLRCLDGEPYTLEYTHMPIGIIPGLNAEVLTHSIYSYIQNDLGLRIGSSYRVIRANIPDAYDRKYLECSDNDPVLEIEQVVYLDNGMPFEYSRSRHRYDKGGVSVNNQVTQMDKTFTWKKKDF
ncbi:GntR family transcriptional regulator [Ethanoligenens harbinense]|uniref:Transcriptional regulator, GntR family n=1 Tax=Ethanoligenens harbinense (strain DSM 18485 / JCM 12961 / CGMCC 1.5033 / YUAN-3) TaxID=663278 RepID=E6U3B6_ETHHY|nr:GntR family transcriptional regulator [Ethanoligenens harbinense]ADU26408.1 transcriptional regulator, GntR family [Ethanoligenens harbinense YUAN-3]AVQ95532.1 GntR family transcriptional regulator [Ethanoligenens harbinense YUAN-3]AYF38196.1 GntR family transcriptional regulator [Ethanoligenens harbinense]AYF40941.1 GntR family transcriptional regulator [Ethanoligenens harbinense]QCN91773.1 GntR family transcriptional regulator [Ethanoligenens harbinense]